MVTKVDPKNFSVGCGVATKLRPQALRPHSSISPVSISSLTAMLLHRLVSVIPLLLLFLFFVAIDIDVTSSQCQYVIAECQFLVLGAAAR